MAKRKFRVQLARLQRETKIVEVEAESRDKIDLSEVYFDNCDEDDWEPDVEWGCEEGTHLIQDDSGTFTDC